MHDDTSRLRSSLIDLCLDRIALFEDFAKAEESALEDLLTELAAAMSHALEIFDAQLFADRPEGWRVKDTRPRSILTEFGEVTFSRRVYIDEFGDRRTYLDEIVSLRPRKRLSPGAFKALALFGSEIPCDSRSRVDLRRGRSYSTCMGFPLKIAAFFEHPLSRGLVLALTVSVLVVAVPRVAWGYREPNTDIGGTGCDPGCHTAPAYNYDDPAVRAGCAECHAPYEHRAFPYYGSGPGESMGPHGYYKSVTNRCGVCHTLHDAAPGSYRLLPGSSISSTCFACHDGTGGHGVYGTIKARTGTDPPGGHPVVSTSTVPGGSASTGGSSVVTFRGAGGALTCSDCHSPHGNNLVAAFRGDRKRLRDNWPIPYSSRLLRQRPTSSATTATAYGSDWCLGCHKGRGIGAAMNHPVDSLATTSSPHNYSFVVVLDSDGPTNKATGYGSLGGIVYYAPPHNYVWSPNHGNRGFLMLYPRVPLQQGHAPICQQCHEDKRNPGTLASDGSSATVNPSLGDGWATQDSGDGIDPTDNPRFQTFPHETENDRMVIETGDDLCLNCHPTGKLP